METPGNLIERVAAVCGAIVITLLIGAGGLLAQQHANAAAVREAQRSESLRIQRAMLDAAQRAQAAWMATTPPEARARQKDTALREFQAAEAEMLQQQTLARLAREARTATSAPEKETGR